MVPPLRLRGRERINYGEPATNLINLLQKRQGGAYTADVSISQIIDNERSSAVRNFPPFSEPTLNTPYADQ